jgi:hypothetical protein
MAAVADKAAPGDVLYGVDRAYERLTDLFGSQDRAAERLSEAAMLSARGDDAGALDLTIEALGELPDNDDVAEAVAALNQAADAPGQVKTEALREETGKLVGLLQDLVDAEIAQGDPQAMAELAKKMREQAKLVKIEAHKLGGPPVDHGKPKDPGPPGTAPGSTAPGRTN